MPSWLDYRAFIASVLAMFGAQFRGVVESNYSLESLIFCALTAIFGGFVWGIVITWAMKRFYDKK